MEVTVAKSAGFCFGVKRAVDTVYREIESGEKPVYTMEIFTSLQAASIFSCSSGAMPRSEK